MAEDGARRQQSAFLIDMSVIARAHVQMVDFFELFTVLSQMGLEIRLETRREFRCTAHYFVRAGHREARAERVLEQSVFRAMPLAAKPLTFQERNRKDLLWLNLSVGAQVHHHFPENRPDAASARGFEADVATVFINGGVGHDGGGAISRELAEKLRRLGARLGSGELSFHRKNVLAQPWQQFAFAARDGGVLRQVRVAVDQARKNR